MNPDNFQPFYDKIFGTDPVSFAWRFLFCFFIGLLSFALHSYIIGDEIVKNKGWLLSVLMSGASASLLFATHVFRQSLAKFDIRLTSKQKARFQAQISTYLSNKRFLMFGFCIASATIALAFIFGLPEVYQTPITKPFILAMLFIAGFICGLAFGGIVGVTKCLSNVFDENSSCFDFTADDGCGGTLFFGWSLLVYSLVTLFSGVLITLYISYSAWAHMDNFLVKTIYYGFIGLPYVSSFLMLIIPSIVLHQRLSEYKEAQSQTLSDKINAISAHIDTPNISAEKKAEYYQDYEFYIKMRSKVYAMRTWPFGISTNATFLFSMLAGGFTTFNSVHKWIDTIDKASKVAG
ncbi:hypothetical protein [Agaribacter flavus]|uniref:Uncharacterized protein n=1 Tax=Agaribacter flavus TaxID=1902781 RepID=A0ABV7FR30_9ALTE